MSNGLTQMLILYGIGAFFLSLFLFALVPYIFEVSEGIRYYKMEIKRSSDEETRKFWKIKLKRFILKQIPVVNLFIKDKRK